MPWDYDLEDEAVATAYGWPTDLSDDEVLRRLLALNQERTSQIQPVTTPQEQQEQ